MKKKIFLTILIIAVMVFSSAFFVGCNTDDAPGMTIVGSEQGITLEENGTKTLTVDFGSANVTDTRVFWHVVNDWIATIDDNGRLTAHSVGRTEVVAESFCGEYTARSEVRVTALANRRVTDIFINGFSNQTVVDEAYRVINVGILTDPQNLSITFAPYNAFNRGFTLESSNSEILSVTQSGILRHNRLGRAVITATSEEDPSIFTTVVFYVGIDTVSSVARDRNRILGAVGAMPVYVRPMFNQHIVQDRTVTWTSHIWGEGSGPLALSEDVASVDDSGRVTFNSQGRAILRATARVSQGVDEDGNTIYRTIQSNNITVYVTDQDSIQEFPNHVRDLLAVRTSTENTRYIAYWIRTAEQLQSLAFLYRYAQGDAAAREIWVENRLNRLFILANDIDLDTIPNFVTIGSYSGPRLRFRGTLDGNGFAIKNLNIDQPGGNRLDIFNSPNPYRNLSNPDGNNLGLFGFIHSEGNVRNLTMDGGSVRGRSVGTIAGLNDGVIENVVIRNMTVEASYVLNSAGVPVIPEVGGWSGLIAAGNGGNGRIFNSLVDSHINYHMPTDPGSPRAGNRLIAGVNWNYISGVFVNRTKFVTDDVADENIPARKLPPITNWETRNSTIMNSAILRESALRNSDTFLTPQTFRDPSMGEDILITSPWSESLWYFAEGQLPRLRPSTLVAPSI